MVRDGKIADEYLAELEGWANKHKKPWTVGVGSYAPAALIRELRELRKEVQRVRNDD